MYSPLKPSDPKALVVEVVDQPILLQRRHLRFQGRKLLRSNTAQGDGEAIERNIIRRIRATRLAKILGFKTAFAETLLRPLGRW